MGINIKFFAAITIMIMGIAYSFLVIEAGLLFKKVRKYVNEETLKS